MPILGGYPLLYQEIWGYTAYLYSLVDIFMHTSHFRERKTPLDFNDMPPEPGQKVCKPRATHKPYNRAPKLPSNGQQPLKTSAITPQKHSRHNLTLNDWLTVVAYYDAHQPISQEEVIKHFASKKDGARIFAQSSLSRHLSDSGRKEDKARLDSNPTALSAKCVCVVT